MSCHAECTWGSPVRVELQQLPASTRRPFATRSTCKRARTPYRAQTLRAMAAVRLTSLDSAQKPGPSTRHDPIARIELRARLHDAPQRNQTHPARQHATAQVRPYAFGATLTGGSLAEQPPVTFRCHKAGLKGNHHQSFEGSKLPAWRLSQHRCERPARIGLCRPRTRWPPWPWIRTLLGSSCEAYLVHRCSHRLLIQQYPWGATAVLLDAPLIPSPARQVVTPQQEGQTPEKATEAGSMAFLGALWNRPLDTLGPAQAQTGPQLPTGTAQAPALVVSVLLRSSQPVR